MTSSKPREVFIYLQLPHSLEIVTAAKLTWREVTDKRFIGEVVYGKKFLGRARSQRLPALDPIHLPLEERLFTFEMLGGLPGIVRDASPDYWGRLVVQRMHPGRVLNEIDYLLNSPEDRVGALSFGLSPIPPAPVRKFNRTINLKELLAEADKIQTDPDYIPKDKPLTDQIQTAISPGTSMGGARPKVVVENEAGLWLAKLPAQGDKKNYAKIEHGALLLAKAVGIKTPTSRVIKVAGKDVLLVKRFDRKQTKAGYHRAMLASGLTILDAEEDRRANTLADGSSPWSYVVLATRLALWSSDPQSDLHELFVRLAFNAMVTNDDDHPRNHAVLNWGSGWRLSPLYDVVPHAAIAQAERLLALDIGEQGRLAARANILSRCEQFRLSKPEASTLLTAMEKVVRRWPNYFKKAGLSAREIDEISGAFLYPGYWRE